jgi:hypothetical protein
MVERKAGSTRGQSNDMPDEITERQKRLPTNRSTLNGVRCSIPSPRHVYFEVYMDLKLFFEHKLKEQCDWRDAEIAAQRRTINEQYQALKAIYELKETLMAGGKYHHILRHLETKLDAIFKIALNRIGG